MTSRSLSRGSARDGWASRPLRGAIAAGAVAVTALLAACSGSGAGGGHAATSHSPGTGSSPSASGTPSPTAPATRIGSFPIRIGGYRLVNKKEQPVSTTTKNPKFLKNSSSFAASERAGFYLPGHKKRQVIYMIAGKLSPGVSPADAVSDYLAEFLNSAVHVTAKPAGKLGGTVKCWVSQGLTVCMWADNGTFGILTYEPPFGLDTALIRHLAAVVPTFRQALERVQS